MITFLRKFETVYMVLLSKKMSKHGLLKRFQTSMVKTKDKFKPIWCIYADFLLLSTGFAHGVNHVSWISISRELSINILRKGRQYVGTVWYFFCFWTSLTYHSSQLYFAQHRDWITMLREWPKFTGKTPGNGYIFVPRNLFAPPHPRSKVYSLML